MNLQENIHRIKEVMGLLIEDENQPAVKGVNHGFVIKQPYQEGQEGEKLNSFIIGVTHFDEKNPVYLKKDDINSSEIEEIKQVATNCGYYYEGIGGPDLINIERFFKEELGLNEIEEHGSYEPKIDNEKPDKNFKLWYLSENQSWEQEGAFVNRLSLYQPELYTSTRLNGIVDAASAESYPGYVFNKKVESWLNTKDLKLKNQIESLLKKWIENHASLEGLFETNEKAKMIQNHSENLSSLATLALKKINEKKRGRR